MTKKDDDKKNLSADQLEEYAQKVERRWTKGTNTSRRGTTGGGSKPDHSRDKGSHKGDKS